MKLIILAVVALAAVALAAPPVDQQQVQILRSSNEQQVNGAYLYSFETENNIKQEEAGEVKVVNDEENKPHEVVVARGSYSYVDPEGNPHAFTYFADETGFHVEGLDVPKSA